MEYIERLIWEGALYINQQDEWEKNVQGAIMCDIYKRAEKTIIWLGHASDTSDATLALTPHLLAAAKTDNRSIGLVGRPTISTRAAYGS